jgi:hypothetical protein
MIRKITIILIRIVSVLFILWGIINIIFVTVAQSRFDHPVAICVLGLSWGSAGILLGILSWKRADCFRSSFSALLLLVGRTSFFSLAYAMTFGVASSFESPRAHWAPEMRLSMAITDGVFALLFLCVTFALTLGKKKSFETQSSPKKRINIDKR